MSKRCYCTITLKEEYLKCLNFDNALQSYADLNEINNFGWNLNEFNKKEILDKLPDNLYFIFPDEKLEKIKELGICQESLNKFNFILYLSLVYNRLFFEGICAASFSKKNQYEVYSNLFHIVSIKKEVLINRIFYKYINIPWLCSTKLDKIKFEELKFEETIKILDPLMNKTEIIIDELNDLNRNVLAIRKILKESPQLESWGGKRLLKVAVQKGIILNEGEILSQPAKIVYPLVLKKFPKLGCYVEGTDEPNDTQEFIFQIEKEYFNLIEELIILMRNLGWFPYYIKQIINEDGLYRDKKYTDVFLKESIIDPNSIAIDLYFECKFDKVIPYQQLPNFLYHLTPIERVEKINKIGLCPKDKSKKTTHLGRIYLLLTNEISLIEELCYSLYRSENIKFRERTSGIYQLIAIKKEVFENKIISYDLNYFEGCWTTSNISPSDLIFEKIIDAKTIRLR